MQEQGKYKIGEYTFQTFHEYRDGQEDVRKIECINKELNIQDPEVAVRLYNDIRSGKIVFKSPIGDQFFAHLADIVADKSVDLLEDKAVVEEAEGKVKYQKILGVAFIILALVSFAVFGIAEIRDIVTTRQMQKLADQVETPNRLLLSHAFLPCTDHYEMHKNILAHVLYHQSQYYFRHWSSFCG